MNKSDNSEPLQEFQVILIQGVHFYDVQAYFLELFNNFCIFGWFADHENFILVKKQTKPDQKEQKVTYIHGTILVKGVFKHLILREEKLLHKNQIMYSWVDDQSPAAFKMLTDFRVYLKIEVQLVMKQKTTQNLIKIVFLNYRDCENTSLTFAAFSETGKVAYGYKQNFCNLSKNQDIVYPKLRQTYVQTQTKIQQKKLILLLNQNNMKEMPFFQSLLQNLIKDGVKVPKIIGHPLNLLLIFLINQHQSLDQKIGRILLNYKKYEMKRPTIKDTNKDLIAIRLSALIVKVLGQQNLLQPSFIDFFAQNLVNDQFQQNFIELVRLYYKILLEEDIGREEVRTAIFDNFYVLPQQQLKNNTNNFTSLLKFIEFKHDLIIKDVLFAISKEIKAKTKKDVSEFTLLDLYSYNQIQYTFIGYDIDNQIVRFFNYQTAPNLPISAILSLIQILPMPFKSIVWKQEWGRYKININGKQKQISLAGHEIIDTKYILQCPLDLIEDPYIRKCYFSNNTHPQTKIQAITPLKINLNEIKVTEDVMRLLKAMKNSAIDSLPKIRLVWKILTTKNLVQIDLNKVQTLYQIPILAKVLKINETSKNYLKNLNLEVNQQRILTTSLAQFPIVKYDFQNIYYKSRQLADFFESKFVNNASNYLQIKSALGLAQQIKNLRRKLKLINNITYEDTLWFKAKIQNLLKSYDLKQKYVYKEMVKKFNNKLQSNRILFNINVVKCQLEKMLVKLTQSEVKIYQKEQENQIKGTNARLSTQTYTYIAEENQKNNLQSSLKEVKKFISQLKNTVSQPYKYKNSLEFYNIEFQKLTYKVSRAIFQSMENNIQTQQLQELYAQFFQISPHLYNLKQIVRNKFYTNKLINDFLINNQKNMPIHMIIGGKDNNLLLQAHLLLNMRHLIAQNETKRIAKITSSGFHSILAFLFCLNIDKQTMIQELIGLDMLVRVKNCIDNQQNINIIELLARTVDSQQKLYYFQKNIKVTQIKLKLIKKYSKINKVLSQFQSSIEMGNQYKLIKVYSNIQDFDSFFANEDLGEKQQQIIDYVQQEIAKSTKKKVSQDILKQNQQMLYQKIILNRVGIKFTIKFLYRDVNADVNWESIHKSQYKQLFLYKAHLINLMKKYNVNPDVNLVEFNRGNYHRVKLCFAFINQTDFRYEFITQDSQPHVKLIDLLIVSASSPAYIGAYPLTTEDYLSQKYVKNLADKVEKKFRPSDPQRRYWSCGNLNPFPFNIIQSECQSEVVLCFNPQNKQQNGLQYRSSNEFKYMKKISKKQIQSRNLRALDLISFWWTKPKKLTPELKQLMFGNIYSSPFSRLYFFIQNSSYQQLLRKVQKRSALCLKDQQQHIIKSQIIRKAIDQIDTSIQRIYYVKIRRQSDQKDQKIVVQCVKSSKTKLSWLYVNGRALKQLNKVTILSKNEYLEFSCYQKASKKLNLFNVTISLDQFLQSTIFIELVISQDNEIKVNKLSILSGKLTKTQVFCNQQYKILQFQQCMKCEEPFKKNQAQKSPFCPLCAKKKQFKLCLFVNFQLKEMLEHEPQLFESEPEIRQEKRWNLRRYLCCLSRFKHK